MGSWNKTCALSNLPIYDGDDVYVFVLQQSEHPTNHCESTHLYSVALAPFQCEYNDYGAGEECKGVALKYLLKGLTSLSNFDDLTEEDFFRKVRDPGIFVKRVMPTCYADSSKVEFAMVRKDVADLILYTWVPNTILSSSFNFLTSQLDTYIDKLLEYASKINCKAGSTYVWTYSLDLILQEYDSEVGHLIYRTLNSYENYTSFFNLREILPVLLTNGDRKELRELLFEYLKGTFLNEFMQETRRSWIPQCGEGHNDEDLDAHLLLSTTISSTIAKLNMRDRLSDY